MNHADYCTALARGAAARRHRRGVVISGSEAWAKAEALRWLAHYPGEDAVIVSENFPGADAATPCRPTVVLPADRRRELLGREFSIAVLDCFSGLDPDAMGILGGTVRAGGVLIMLTPELAAWPDRDDPQYTRLVSSGYPNPGTSHYLARMVRMISDSPAMRVMRENAPPPLPRETGAARDNAPDYSQQRAAVAAVVNVISGQRRRPMVISADRGRGKSSALGMAAAQLIEGGVRRIGVTGPGRKAVAEVFRHAGLKADDPRLTYYPPEQLVREQPDLDLVLVDEAAAISPARLAALLQRYPRIAFTGTVHGYEGAGRGFALRFRRMLDHATRGCREVVLHSPVRWAEGDPLESFLFDALLLNAEPEIPGGFAPDPARLAVQPVAQAELARDEKLLRDVFGLLVQAHYRTRPFDLRHLLDSTSSVLLRAHQDGVTLGVALLNREGGLDRDTALQVWKNRARPNGHLLPELLCAQQGMLDAALLHCVRVMRIVVHPAFRRMGVGKRLVETAWRQFQSRADYFGADFSLEPGVVRFWRQCGFSAVRIGLDAGGDGGRHALCMLRPWSGRGGELARDAGRKFSRQFPWRLAADLSDLDAETALAVLAAVHPGAAPQPLDETERDDLLGIALAGHDPDNFPGTLRRLFLLAAHRGALGELPADDTLLFLERVFQGRDWRYCTPLSGSQGRRQGAARIRRLARCMLEALDGDGLAAGRARYGLDDADTHTPGHE